MMLTLEEVISRLKDRNLKKVSDSTGINYSTLTKLTYHPSDRTEYRTVKALSDYLEGHP